MKVELSEREISVIQCALYYAKDEYLKHSETTPHLGDVLRMQAAEATTIYEKLENL